MNRLLWIGSFCYLLLGLGHVVIGSLLPELLQSYGKAYGDGGTLLFTQFAGFLAGVLLMPIWARRWGRRGMVLVCLAVMALAQALYAAQPPWAAVYAVAVAAGIGLGGIEAAIGALVIDAVKERQAVAMSRLEVFFGLGALLMPLVAGLFIHAGRWPLAFAAIAVFAAALALLWQRMSFGAEIDGRLRRAAEAADPAPERTGGAMPAAAMYSRRGLWVLGLFVFGFFAYVGLEISLVSFAPSMLVERFRMDSGAASLGVTLYWVAMTFGRVFCGFLAERFGYLRYLLVSCGVTALGFATFAAAKGPLWSFLAMAAAGIGMAGIFSIALVFANKLLPGTTERTTSVLIAAGGIGGAVMPLATGRLMDAAGPVAAVWLLVGATALLAALLAATHLVRRTAGASAGRA